LHVKISYHTLRQNLNSIQRMQKLFDAALVGLCKLICAVANILRDCTFSLAGGVCLGMSCECDMYIDVCYLFIDQQKKTNVYYNWLEAAIKHHAAIYRVEQILLEVYNTCL